MTAIAECTATCPSSKCQGTVSAKQAECRHPHHFLECGCLLVLQGAVWAEAALSCQMEQGQATRMHSRRVHGHLLSVQNMSFRHTGDNCAVAGIPVRPGAPPCLLLQQVERLS